jgi:hypothetical protein
MSSPSPLQSAESALLRVSPPPDESPLRRAERRLQELLIELDALDTELDTLRAGLERFARDYEDALAQAFDDVGRAERLLRRLRTLQDTLAALLRRLQDPEPLPPPPPRKAPEASTARDSRPLDTEEDDEPHDAYDGLDDDVPPEDEEPSEDDPEAPPEDEALARKRLYRRLARLLHPDLAQTEAERERFSTLMVTVNVAYEAGDTTTLELIAAKVGAGVEFDSVSEDERLAHLERRIRTLSTAVRSLRQQRDGLLSTATARLFEESRRRSAQGRDYLAETRAEMRDEAHSLAQDARARLRHLERAARTLSTVRNQRMSPLAPSGKGRKLRVFDPVLESPLVRQGALRLERQRATPAARELARHLEDLASQSPWQLALTLMAFFAEAAGRPPPGLASSDTWAERYELLREISLPGAPAYDEALTRLPRHLELGLRVQKKDVRFGLQLRDTELLAAIPLALQREPVAELARDVLSVLGPQEACRACKQEVLLVHLMRTRGLDELHGMLCPLCAHVQKSYWSYNTQPEGLEALLPHARRLGAISEQVLRLAGTSIGFQLLPEERAGLTAARLRQRFADLYLTPYGVELEPAHLRLVHGGRELELEGPVPQAVITLKLAPEAGRSEREVLELLRSRIERRFRPDAAT